MTERTSSQRARHKHTRFGPLRLWTANGNVGLQIDHDEWNTGSQRKLFTLAKQCSPSQQTRGLGLGMFSTFGSGQLGGLVRVIASPGLFVGVELLGLLFLSLSRFPVVVEGCALLALPRLATGQACSVNG